MPPDRRRRRFRRPGANRWITESISTLRLELASTVRSTLTAWMRLYGEANSLPGLASGPIETRFARLRQHCADEAIIVWTTPTNWAGGEGLSLRLPTLRLEFGCTLGDGHLVATRVTQVPEDAGPPDREPGAVGVFLTVEHFALPPENGEFEHPDPGVALLEGHFGRLAGRRWGGFVEPLRAVLEAEASDDEERTHRLTVRYTGTSLIRSGEEDVWKLVGIPADTLRQLDEGEWLEILDEHGRSASNARVVRTRYADGSLEAGVRGAADPPRVGFVRPRSRRKILEQKRALLDELASPTGSLPNLVRLVAAPASMPIPTNVRPPRFVNPAVMRNRSQARAVSLALGLEDGQALMIQGPPGTGKSTTAAEIDVQLILRDPAVRILVCSHSNHGTDNMLRKVLPFLDDAAERIARVGFYDRVAKDARPYYAPPDADLGDRNVIFTTIDALALQDVAGARVYDYVILDEANRAGVLDSLLALARGRRMILVGDAMQLQPVMSEAEQQAISASQNGRRGGGVAIAPKAGAQHVVGKSLFAWLLERHFAQAATVLLDQQNRMHPAIGELVSRVFYSGRVRTGPAAPRRGTGLPLLSAPVTWVDTRSLRGNVESRAGGTSVVNVAEGRLVASLTRYIAARAPQNLTIGVIAAYSEQKDLLRRLMGQREGIPEERELEIDTVDAFEGREKDVILLSLVRSNRRRDIGFLRLEQRLNVAVSRARRLLVIVGDTSTLRGGYFNHLISTASSVGQILSAPKLAGQISGRARQDHRDRRRDQHPAAAEPPAEGAQGATAEEGAEAPAGETRRQRRRRAWERRRERLRELAEQRRHKVSGIDGVVAEPTEFTIEPEHLEVDVAVATSTAPEPEPVAEPQARPVRRRRRLERQPASDGAVGATAPTAEQPAPETPPVPAESVATAPEPPVAEVPVEAKPARRVRRSPAPKTTAAEPEPVPEPGRVELDLALEPAPTEPAPARRPRRVSKRKPEADAAAAPPPTAPETEPLPTPVPIPHAENGAAAPPRKRAPRARKVVVESVPAEPAVNGSLEPNGEVASAKPKRPPRARKTAAVAAAELNPGEA